MSIWATAPYLHNNSVGLYNGDPSVAGRMAAYEDGMTKLLWPERRLGLGSMLVTTQDSKLPDFFPMLMKLIPSSPPSAWTLTFCASPRARLST